MSYNKEEFWHYLSMMHGIAGISYSCKTCGEVAKASGDEVLKEQVLNWNFVCKKFLK